MRPVIAASIYAGIATAILLTATIQIAEYQAMNFGNVRPGFIQSATYLVLSTVTFVFTAVRLLPRKPTTLLLWIWGRAHINNLHTRTQRIALIAAIAGLGIFLSVAILFHSFGYTSFFEYLIFGTVYVREPLRWFAVLGLLAAIVGATVSYSKLNALKRIVSWVKSGSQ